MSRSDIVAAQTALRGLQLGFRRSGDDEPAELVTEILTLLADDLYERDAERDRGRRRRDRPLDETRPSTGRVALRPPDEVTASTGQQADEWRTEGGRGGVGGGSDLLLSSSSPDLSLPHSEIARAKPVSVMADGAFGMTISAWSEGLSSVTGQPCTTPAVGAVRVLLGALGQHRPTNAEPVEWSRTIAREYAEANRGRNLSAFGFADWMNSGRPVRPSQGSSPAVGTPAWEPMPREQQRARERERDASHDRLRREQAAPEQIGASVATILAAVGGDRSSGTVARARPREPPSATERPVAIRHELTDEQRESRRQEQMQAAATFASARNT